MKWEIDIEYNSCKRALTPANTPADAIAIETVCMSTILVA